MTILAGFSLLTLKSSASTPVRRLGSLPLGVLVNRTLLARRVVAMIDVLAVRSL